MADGPTNTPRTTISITCITLWGDYRPSLVYCQLLYDGIEVFFFWQNNRIIWFYFFVAVGAAIIARTVPFIFPMTTTSAFIKI
jgi:hypothetical protein